MVEIASPPISVNPAAQGENKALTSDQAIVLEANERFKSQIEWQGTEDERSRQDIKFANGDSRNFWQWDGKVLNSRGVGTNDELPCLTINNTRTHNDLIINDICKQDFGIKIRPVAGKASYQAAKMMEALIRRIQDQSTFAAQRRKVAEQQVDGGIGYITIETRYVSERSFNQDIFLKASRDPCSVYVDRYIAEPSGSDAKYGFEFDRMPRKDFKHKYPKYADRVGTAPIASAFVDWMSDKEIVVVKYYRKKETDDVLVAYEDENGELVHKLKSEIIAASGREIYDALMDDIESGHIEGNMRDTTNNSVEWFLIAGDQIVERGKHAGKYIPICRCVGRELVIDNTLDRKGHTRPLMDAQRNLNYSISSDIQYAFSQTKSQWLASARAIEGQEQWKTTNTDNFSVMTYNDLEEEAPEGMQKIDKPERIPPGQPNPAYQAAAAAAERHMMMISGQWQAQLGVNDQQSASSGNAINARKQQSDTATYHFFEHQSDMLRHIGKQLLDLMPKIYDTERALQVIGEKGEKFWIRIDPNQEDIVRELKDEKIGEEALKLAFNPNLGEYECVSDPGPDYATQRQEAWNALSLILQQAKELSSVCADLLFKYGDFPGADEIMERIQKEIKATKPYLFDDGPDPSVAAMTEQIQKLTGLNTELVQKLAIMEIKHKGYAEKRDIDAQNADTNRMKATIDLMTKIMLTPAQREQLDHELVKMGHQHVYKMVQQINQADLAPQDESESME